MVIDDPTLLLAARVILHVIAWPLAALLAWRAARGRVSPAAWGVVVLLLSQAMGEALADSAPSTSRAFYAVGNSAIAVLFAIYPDGRAVPRWILIPAGFEVAIQVANVISGLRLEELQPWWPLHLLITWAVLLWFGQIHRYRRRSSVAEREAVRWPVLAFILLVSTFTAWSLLQMALNAHGEVGGAWLAVLLNCLPALGLAGGLLIPRALPVDPILRTTLLVSLTALSVAAVGLGAANVLTTSVDPIAAAWLTGAITAATLLPLASAARWIANRIVGRGVDPLRTLTELGNHLAASADPLNVPDDVVRIVATSLALPGVRLGGNTVFEAAVGSSGPDDDAFPVVYRNETIATLFAAARAGESKLSESDRAVLGQIAVQVAPALHGARVVAELIDARTRVVLAREEERKRLRRELHDDLAPTFAGLGLSAAAIEELSRPGDGRVSAAAARLVTGLQDATRQVREIAYDLRPPVLDERGLIAAIEERVMTGRPEPEVSLDAAELGDALPAAVEAAAFRIVQEAVLNVRRHAAARSCIIRLSTDRGWLRVEVADDGIGWTDGPSGVGVRGMRERASELGGSLEITGTGTGCRVVALLPLPAPTEFAA